MPLPRNPSLLALLLSAWLALPACSGGGPSAGTQAAEGGLQTRELPSVRVAAVEVRAMSRVLETTSKLESEREIQIVPRTAGVVLELGAEEGDVVAQGAVLAVLEDVQQALAVRDAEVAQHEAQNALDKLKLALRESEARVNSTQFALEQARRDYERNQRLFSGETVASALSRSALEASQLARDNAEADRLDADLARERTQLELTAGETAVDRAVITLERARVELGYTKVLAPFAGIVAQRNVKVGDAVGPATMAFVLTDVSTLRAVFARPQEELELFGRAGEHSDGRLAIRATADAFPGRTFAGWVERISPTIDPQSGQFRVTGRLECVQENGRVRLLPGMLVRLRILTERHAEALVVPKRALDREGDRRFVLVAQPEADGDSRRAHVRRVEVSEGFAEGESIEVLPKDTSELAAGDLVVVVGGDDLAAGDTVEVDAGSEAAAPVAPPAEGVAEAK